MAYCECVRQKVHSEINKIGNPFYQYTDWKSSWNRVKKTAAEQQSIVSQYWKWFLFSIYKCFWGIIDRSSPYPIIFALFHHFTGLSLVNSFCLSSFRILKKKYTTNAPINVNVEHGSQTQKMPITFFQCKMNLQ